jgi:uncharacterized membrane protein YqjE
LDPKKENPSRSLWMLGLALTLPMILLSGPLAGFLIGQWVFVDQLKMPAITTPLLMMLGLVGSGIQAYRLIKKLKENHPTL